MNVSEIQQLAQYHASLAEKYRIAAAGMGACSTARDFSDLATRHSEWAAKLNQHSADLTRLGAAPASQSSTPALNALR